MRTSAVTASFFAASVLALACNDSSLAPVPDHPVIEVTPGAMDFGRQEIDYQIVDVITIKNKGGAPLVISGLSLASPDAEFGINGNLPTAAAPVTLQHNETYAVQVRYISSYVGQFATTLSVVSNDPARPTVDVPLSALAYELLHESFTQGSDVGGEADILFVVDTSGSMSDDQTKLANSFQTFINWLTTGKVDYHVAVTDMDISITGLQGKFSGSPAVLTSTTPNVAAKFATNVQMGANGSAEETGLASAKLALSNPNLSGPNAGFLRASADLFVVFVSDEEDQSTGGVQTYIDHFESVKTGTGKAHYAAIAGPPPSGCFGAESGFRYHTISKGTGGLFDTICQNNFGATLQKLAFEIIPPKGEFFLDQLPIKETIVVEVDGQLEPGDHYFYDEPRNAIVFYEAYNPHGGAAVVISYETGPQGA